MIGIIGDTDIDKYSRWVIQHKQRWIATLNIEWAIENCEQLVVTDGLPKVLVEVIANSITPKVKIFAIGSSAVRLTNNVEYSGDSRIAPHGIIGEVKYKWQDKLLDRIAAEFYTVVQSRSDLFIASDEGIEPLAKFTPAKKGEYLRRDVPKEHTVAYRKDNIYGVTFLPHVFHNRVGKHYFRTFGYNWGDPFSNLFFKEMLNPTNNDGNHVSLVPIR